MSGSSDQQRARKGRQAAIVIAATALLWLGASWLGAWLELSHRTRALFDLAALAGFIWAFWMIWQVWRMGQKINSKGQR